MNGATSLVTWEKGVLDGVYGFDVEMARMSQDGLMKLARNGPYCPFLPRAPILISSLHSCFGLQCPKYSITRRTCG